MTGINEFGGAQDGSDLPPLDSSGETRRQMIQPRPAKGIDVVTAQPGDGATHPERPLVVGRATPLGTAVKPDDAVAIARVFAAAEAAKTGDNAPVAGAKSKATTANPKDLFGAVKVDFSKFPAIGYAWGAMAMMDGADKYGPYNWRDKPVIASIYVAASIRHVLDWWEGQRLAPDSEVHHLGHAIACNAILLDAEHRGVLIDDRPAHDDMLAAALDEMSATLKKHAVWKREGSAAYDRWAGAKDGRTPPKAPYTEVAAVNYWQRGFDFRKKQVEES